MKIAIRCILLTGLMFSMQGYTQSTIDIIFSGDLVNRPCLLAPGNEILEVTFMTRSPKDFYKLPGRSPVQTFDIKLDNCDTNALWKLVKLKFEGVRESNMAEEADYFLRLNSGSNIGKLAIGLIDIDDTTRLKLGEFHNRGQGTMIDTSSLVMTFGAYLQASPDAITNRTLETGDYAATANFTLNYE